MIDSAYVQRMARYNRWQNENLYGVADRLPPEERRRERGDAHGFEGCFIASGGGFAEDLLFKLRDIGHGGHQSGMTVRSVSDGRPPAWVSMQWTWPRWWVW